jgi:D-alanine-D-alanine ligase
MPLKIAIVFDTPWEGWDHAQHLAQLDKEIANQDEVEPEMEYQVAHALRTQGHDVHLIGLHDDLAWLLHEVDAAKPDLAFNCAESFHGRAHLEYVVAAALETKGVNYVGSPPTGLIVSRNKAMSKEILAYHGVRVPGFMVCPPGVSPCRPEGLGFPLIVKPVSTDASEGIAQASVVFDDEALAARVKFIHEQFHDTVIVESFVEGRELYVSLLGNEAAIDVLPLTELVFDKEKNAPEERIATRSAKWNVAYRERRGIRNQFARPVSAQAREEIERACRTAFRALQLRDYARCDVRLDAEDRVWLVEANANPFIAEGHDFAEAAHKSGLEYPALINRLVELAQARVRHD